MSAPQMGGLERSMRCVERDTPRPEPSLTVPRAKAAGSCSNLTRDFSISQDRIGSQLSDPEGQGIRRQ